MKVTKTDIEYAVWECIPNTEQEDWVTEADGGICRLDIGKNIITATADDGSVSRWEVKITAKKLAQK